MKSNTDGPGSDSQEVPEPQKGYVVGQSITHKFKYEPIQTLTPIEMAQADFYQNCVFRSTTAGIAGGVMGVAFGIFMGAMEPASLSTPAPLADQPSKSAWQVFKSMVRTTGQRSSCVPTRACQDSSCQLHAVDCKHELCMCRMYARSFGMIGLLYSGIECVIEGHRGRHDVYNSFYTGALTGGLLARGSALRDTTALLHCNNVSSSFLSNANMSHWESVSGQSCSESCPQVEV